MSANYDQSPKNTSKKRIIPHLNKLQKITNNTHLNEKSKKLFEKDGDFNCWGFTAYSFKWIKKLEWFEYEEMDYCLWNFSEIVKTPRIGDIVEFRDHFGDLIHTAILTNVKNKTLLHKPGYCTFEVNTIEGAKDIYGHNLKIKYRRVTGNNKFSYAKFNRDMWT